MVDFTFWDILRNLLLAARWTIALSLVAFIGGGIVGIALLFARLRGGAYVQKLVGCYVQVFQGTPLLMQLFLAYFGLAVLGICRPRRGSRPGSRSRSTRAPSSPRSGAVAWRRSRRGNGRRPTASP